ncbi:hypothetical protein [Georgenia satyanarayanai]|uniref:hypothetical protein n=1 Tax=Georgenia satyanarayanai TaxID=860221 RepID=UPI001264152A|nr:hypothetical protein [Georgenia satyanarayanai]
MREIEIVDRAPVLVVGMPVLAGFHELGTLVPAAWRALSRSLGDDDRPLAELSVDLGDGRYHETVGVLVPLEDAARVRVPGAVGSLVPGGAWAQMVHDGPVHTIAETFGRLLAWAAEQGARPGPHKLDVGYRLDGAAERHTLAVELSPAP